MGDIVGEPWSYEQDLIAYAGFLCRHPDDAEDVAHTALLKAALHMTDFRGESSMRTWLHTIVANECRMLHRRTSAVSLDQMADAAAGLPRLPGEEPGYESDPTDSAEQGELRALALATLRDMPSHYRTALFLQLALGKSVEEIAEALQRSVPATKSILHRARRSMREGVAGHLERSPDPD
ncbi:MAG: RNA polymerase sigma factor [Acidimicrobiia bacterium]|nr:RNA polymerase sigma factor [Acidimicrobiia bacterium]